MLKESFFLKPSPDFNTKLSISENLNFAFFVSFSSASTEITLLAFSHSNGVKTPNPVPSSKTTSFFVILASETMDFAIEFEFRKCCPSSLRFIIF